MCRTDGESYLDSLDLDSKIRPPDPCDVPTTVKELIQSNKMDLPKPPTYGVIQLRESAEDCFRRLPVEI